MIGVLEACWLLLGSRWLKEEKGIRVYVEPIVKAELLKDSSYYDFVQTCKSGGYALRGSWAKSGFRRSIYQSRITSECHDRDQILKSRSSNP